MEFEMLRLSPQVLKIKEEVKAGWERWVLLTSDWHIDNPACDRKLLEKHLSQAKEKGAHVFCFGDLFCAMQGKYDKRSDKSSLRAEHQRGDYLDALVDTTAEFLTPYAENLRLISPGNHEHSILSRLETNIGKRLADAIGCQYGSYSGWVFFSFNFTGGSTKQLRMKYHHGYGGGGAVTKDVIQTNRKAVYLPDADIVVSGHTHDRWIFPIERERVSRYGEVSTDTQTHIKLATYKEEYLIGDGWHVETGKPPKPRGGVWLRFFVDTNKDVKFQAMFAE